MLAAEPGPRFVFGMTPPLHYAFPRFAPELRVEGPDRGAFEVRCAEPALHTGEHTPLLDGVQQVAARLPHDNEPDAVPLCLCLRLGRPPLHAAQVGVEWRTRCSTPHIAASLQTRSTIS